ncbi:MAG: hypothetical protein LBO04_07835 [Spirochaetaceae bacterium]|jgi:hypothetical protein|nr:hypothetical protein [Spirochaetaceae bacterium]
MPSIARLLPLPGEDYERKCIELGIIRRAREIKTPADLIMLCLFHLSGGVSLIAVSTVAFSLKTGDFSDEAFMKKFAMCGEWFKPISAGLLRGGLISYPKPAYPEGGHETWREYTAGKTPEKSGTGTRRRGGHSRKRREASGKHY